MITKSNRIRILYVAMAYSVHTARWIGQLSSQKWDIHLFPSIDSSIHPLLSNIIIHDYYFTRPIGLNENLSLAGGLFRKFLRRNNLSSRLCKFLLRKSKINYPPQDRSKRLADLIRNIKPDIIHSHETQHAGYLTLNAKKHLYEKFPVWIHTPWGSDIYLFGRLAAHRGKIRDILSSCDYYGPESNRDIKLARDFGFSGVILPILPVNGGFDLAKIQQFRQPGKTSDRRLIMIKGYQGWAGRALVGLRAIEISAHLLNGYTVAIYSAGEDVKIAAELISHSTGIPIEIIPDCLPDDMLKLYNLSRISLGISISDGVPNSMHEAMAMGAFPIESTTSCANEWIVGGENGLIVNPEDPNSIAGAIRRAVEDDLLVNQAAEMNFTIIKERMDKKMIQAETIAMYEQVVVRARTNSYAEL